MSDNIIVSDILKEKIYEHEYENGLKAFIIPKKNYTKKYAIYSTKFGSIDNKFRLEGEREYKEVPDGIAHFLEHKMFDMPYGNAMDRLTSLGASANAYTSFDHTAYLFSCTDNFDESLKTLVEYVQKPYFPAESVENEKGIIGQEIRMYEDDPEWQTFFNFIKCLYREDPITKDIAGTAETISHITPELLEKCHNTFYHPSNMIICVVGDVNPDEVFEIIEKGQVKHEKLPNIERAKVNEPKGIVAPYTEKNMFVGAPLFMMGYKQDMDVLDKLNRTEYKVGADILLDMLFSRSSDVYKELYEKNLINGYLDAGFEIERNIAYSSISGESKNPSEARNIILKAIKKAKEEGLNREDFERVRKMQLGRTIKSFNSVQTIGNEFVSLYFKGIPLFDYVKKYDEIKFETVEKILNSHFDDEKFAMSVVGA